MCRLIAAEDVRRLDLRLCQAIHLKHLVDQETDVLVSEIDQEDARWLAAWRRPAGPTSHLPRADRQTAAAEPTAGGSCER